MSSSYTLESRHHPWKASLTSRLGGRWVVENTLGMKIAEDLDKVEADTVAGSSGMMLALALVSHGEATIKRSGTLVEFCFQGIRHCVRDDWTDLLVSIGWERCLAALKAAERNIDQATNKPAA